MAGSRPKRSAHVRAKGEPLWWEWLEQRPVGQSGVALAAIFEATAKPRTVAQVGDVRRHCRICSLGARLAV